MSDQSHHPLTLSEILTLPHSALCDAGRVTWVPASEYEPDYMRAVQSPCTCGAGLLRLMVGGR